MRLIDADVAEKIIREYADEVGCNRGEYELANGILKAVCKLEDVQTVEAVPKSYADQIRWERDVAIEQLNEIGCEFGQKMDEVKKKLKMVHGEWIHDINNLYGCSECTNRETMSAKRMKNFCPNCGADMRKKV